jgi:hypothetical protein
MDAAPVRFGEPGRYRLREIHRHEQAGVATLNEQCHLFVVRRYDLAQLLDALHRRAVDRDHHVTRLDAGVGRMPASLLDEQTARHARLGSRSSGLKGRSARPSFPGERPALDAMAVNGSRGPDGRADRDRLAVPPDFERGLVCPGLRRPPWTTVGRRPRSECRRIQITSPTLSPALAAALPCLDPGDEGAVRRFQLERVGERLIEGLHLDAQAARARPCRS